MPARVIAIGRARAPRHVHRAHCGTEFVYELVTTVAVEGDGVSDWVARRETEKTAREDLDARREDPEAFEPVPCPKCYHYQPYMRDRLAEERFGWQGPAIGISLMALGGLAAIGAGVAWGPV